MSDSNESFKKSPRNGRNRRRNYKRYTNRTNRKDFPVCPICEKSVKYLLTAIAVGENNVPAHFDCVIKQLSETEELGPKEKITYIGNGNFAITNGKQGKKFEIRKKIQFEGKEVNAEWRNKISSKLKNR